MTRWFAAPARAAALTSPMRVPAPSFLLELAELAHLAPCGANAQRLRFHVVSGAEDCARVFDELAWAGALKDWPGPDEGERPTGYIAILAERAVPGKPAAPITEVDTGIAAQTMMLAARSATPEVAACMFKAFTPRAIDAMGLDNDKYTLKLVMAFGVPAETQVIDAIDSNPDGSINYWRDEAQVHHVPKRPACPRCCCSCASLRRDPAAKPPQRRLSSLR